MRLPVSRVATAVLSGTVFLTGTLLAGGGAAHAAVAGGALYGWGDDGGGAVGIAWATDDNHPINQPVAVSLPADVVQAVTVPGFGAAVRADGTVWSWGTSNYLQGNGGPTEQLAPHPVPGLPPIATITMDGTTALAVGRDGSLWAWGSNFYGQLGAGVPISLQATPVELVTGGVAGAAVAETTSAYVTTDGVVWTSGSNTSGELGNGTFTARPGYNKAWTPAGVTQLAATDGGFVALRSDGSVWVWGQQFGDIEVAAGRLPSLTPKPTRLDGVTGIKQLAAGSKHSVALAKDGTIWTWGENGYAQLGAGAGDLRSPVHLSTAGVTQVDAADYSSGAIRADGTLLIWGWNKADRLGMGTQGDYVPTPTTKPSLSGVTTAVVGDTAFAVAGAATATPTTVVPTVPASAGAAQLLHDAGLVEGNVYTVPDDRTCNHLGQVKQQSPPAGTVAPFGSRVDLTVVVRPTQPCQ